MSRFPKPLPRSSFPETDYLARGLQEEPLSAGAREQRDSILRRLQRLQTRSVLIPNSLIQILWNSPDFGDFSFWNFGIFLIYSLISGWGFSPFS
uniref:Uncharacterized protein n=1 Tax=Zosterops lateralis melanops TaxID=1220523 RepID=A0A8D2PY95_ZOSLA